MVHTGVSPNSSTGFSVPTTRRLGSGLGPDRLESGQNCGPEGIVHPKHPIQRVCLGNGREENKKQNFPSWDEKDRNGGPEWLSHDCTINSTFVDLLSSRVSVGTTVQQWYPLYILYTPVPFFESFTVTQTRRTETEGRDTETRGPVH